MVTSRCALQNGWPPPRLIRLAQYNNQILNNLFYQNQQEGVVVDQNSRGNQLIGNTITQNAADGLDVRETADGNTITQNTISANGAHGFYVRSNQNVIRDNLITKQPKAGIALLPATNLPLLQENQLLSNTVTLNGENGLDLRKAVKTLVQGNLSEGNGINGIYLSDTASQNTLVKNMIRANNGYGIRANGLQTVNNAWSENVLYGNLTGGTGTLFQRPFGRIEVTSDRYFRRLVLYIHQNPQKHGFVQDFRDWPYSSYHTLLSLKQTLLQRDEVIAWFDTKDGFHFSHAQEMTDPSILAFFPDDFD